MTIDSPEDLYDRFVLENYAKAPITLIRGSGTRVWDDSGEEYLDFTSGIGVNSIGHCHPFWVEQVAKQASRLVHASNLFRNEIQGRLAAIIVGKAGPGRVFFCNSGLEADEALIKLGRKHGVKKSGEDGKCFKILTARNSFHGRSIGGMSATDQEKVRKGFAPFAPGFAQGEFNNIESFEKLIDEQTAAILVETIQGEGGIHVGTNEFLRGLRELCDRHGLLLLMDEVQCGIARTGTFFAFEEAGVAPDAIGMAKGLGGGFPIGAMWLREEHAGLLPAGSHGSTFGGSALACAAALATLTVIEREGLQANVSANGPLWIAQLERIRESMPDIIIDVRGRGYMAGVQLSSDPAPVIAKMREMGLLALSAGGNVVRFLPPLITTHAETEEAARIFRRAIAMVFRK